MANQSDTFIREVDEEVKREQFRKLWEAYGVYIVAAVALLLAGVGLYKFMESRRLAAAEAASARFEAAAALAAENKVEEALRTFEGLAKDGPKSYQTLARLRLAGAAAKAGKAADAVSLFDTLAKDSGIEQLLRDFAALQAAMLRLETADWTEMQNRLKDLAGDQSPGRAQARELKGLAAYKAGKPEEARIAYEQLLGDRTAPPDLVQRVQIMLAVLSDAESARQQPVVPIPVVPPAAPEAPAVKDDTKGPPQAGKKK
jgi:hypothetical protein